jgi:small subunit ribosomal protein S20
MPVIKSAIKQMRKSEAARIVNREVKNNYKSKIKAVKKDLISGGENTAKLVSEAVSAIDKAVKKGVLHKNAASRRKSRLNLSINKALNETTEPVALKAIKKTKTTKKEK